MEIEAQEERGKAAGRQAEKVESWEGENRGRGGGIEAECGNGHGRLKSRVYTGGG